VWAAVVASQEDEVGDCHDAIVMQRVACSKPGSMACKGATADLAKTGCDDAAGPGGFLDHMDHDLAGHSTVKQLGEQEQTGRGKKTKRFRRIPRRSRRASKKRLSRFKRGRGKKTKRFQRTPPRSRRASKKRLSRFKRPSRKNRILHPRRAAGGSRKEKKFFSMLRGLLYSDPRKCGSPGQCAKVVQTALRADKKLQKAKLKVKASKSAPVKECAKVVAKAIKTTKQVMLEQQKKQKLGTPDQCAKVVAAALKIAEKIRPGSLRTKRLKALAQGSAPKYFLKKP